MEGTDISETYETHAVDITSSGSTCHGLVRLPLIEGGSNMSFHGVMSPGLLESKPTLVVEPVLPLSSVVF
jgi:hypothetical protein